MTLDPKDGVDEMIGVLILARQRRKWTLQHIADKCGVPRQVIHKLEGGFMDPPVRLLMDYAEAVGMELSWKLGAKR